MEAYRKIDKSEEDMPSNERFRGGRGGRGMRGL